MLGRMEHARIAEEGPCMDIYDNYSNNEPAVGQDQHRFAESSRQAFSASFDPSGG